MPGRLHRAGHGAGQEVEGSLEPLASYSEGSCILALDLLLPGLRGGNGAGRFLAARLFVANKPLEDSTASVNAGPPPPSAGGERAGPLKALSNGNQDI